MQNQPNNPSSISLKPGEKISKTLLAELKTINDKYTKTKNFSEYRRSIGQLFQLTPVQINAERLRFLAGFCEGEASMSAGIKKNKTSNFKLYIDPEFNITQHVNGISNLYIALCYFQTGRIRHKVGSNATFVFTIDNRQSLKEKVLPYYKEYVNPIGSPFKVHRTEIFEKLLLLFEEKAHLNYDRMMNEVLPLWDQMRIQVGQSNQSFKSLTEAQDYVRQANEDRKKNRN
jgi:hypothetical protein